MDLKEKLCSFISNEVFSSKRVYVGVVCVVRACVWNLCVVCACACVRIVRV